MTEEELIAKYPKIFRQKTLPPTETCMSWGLEVGPGWLPLIDELCAKIQARVDSGACPQVEASQVKEKYGGLRFYTDGHDDVVSEMIEQAEQKASATCERCGGVGKTFRKGWIYTMCDSCWSERKNGMPTP